MLKRRPVAVVAAYPWRWVSSEHAMLRWAGKPVIFRRRLAREQFFKVLAGTYLDCRFGNANAPELDLEVKTCLAKSAEHRSCSPKRCHW